MAEILDFNEHAQKTPEGLFFIAARQQQNEAEQQRLLKAGSSQPSLSRVALAKQELEFIFSGENSKEADSLYRQGLHDVVAQNNSPAAEFYTRVETLAGLANRAHDSQSGASREPLPLVDETL